MKPEKRDEVCVLAAAGMLGSSFDKKGFYAALEKNPDVIGCDSGTSDSGPFFPGAGLPRMNRKAAKRDLELMITEGVKRGIPVLIGSAGTAGADPNVDWMIDIASAAARITSDPRELAIAESCVEVMAATPFFKDGFNYQTGVGGPSIATLLFLKEKLKEADISINSVIGGISTPMVNMMKEGYIRHIADTQDFDTGAIESLNSTPNHFEISCDEYANPLNKGAFVNNLDFVVLSALEVDTDFNVNVITGSDGILRGAPGGHPDTAAGAKCCIIVTPLVRGRMPTICERVVTVTTPGDSVDVVVTDYGVAVNPKRQDIQQSLHAAGIETLTIHELCKIAYDIVGAPDPVEFEDKIVAIIEARDGTVMDVVKQIKPYRFEE